MCERVQPPSRPLRGEQLLRTRCFSEDRSNSADRCDGGRRPHAGQRCSTGGALAAMQEVAGDVTCRETSRHGRRDSQGCDYNPAPLRRDLLRPTWAPSFMPDWAADVCHRWRAILDELEKRAKIRRPIPETGGSSWRFTRNKYTTLAFHGTNCASGMM